jgi:Holliday junction DNA helicase RuvA
VIVKLASGIGHEVYFSTPVQLNQPISLYLTHIQRENLQELYGFKNVNEKRAFELLLHVNGIGPKSAYSLVQLLGFQGLYQAIVFDDEKSLKKASGIGPKAAKQIILSLKDKLKNIEENLNVDVFPGNNEASGINTSAISEARNVLIELGFQEKQFMSLVQREYDQKNNITAEELVKSVLQSLH